MTDELAPLSYHTTVAARLEALEPRVWALFRDAGATGAPIGSERDPAASDADAEDDLEQRLLRHAYRMEADAHPRVHGAARAAAASLGLELPIVIYQLEGRDGANAALAFRPDEAVLALSGNILALLSDEELVACFGHELAHHRLWTSDGGRILVADRMLGALSVDAATPAAYLETARRFELAVELYADRGALIASGNLDVAIASLVKVATGLSDVDPNAFLRQAEAAHPERGTEGTTHPETVLRAWALARWHAGDGDIGPATLLAPSLDIERLDLLDRERLEQLTRRLVLDVLAADWMRSDAVVGHARQFLVEISPSAAPRGGWGRSRPAPSAPASPPVQVHLDGGTPKETLRYLAYVLLDLATVDPDLDDEALAEVAAVAREAGLAASFEEVARRELGLSQRSWDALIRRSRDRRTGPAAEPGPSAAPEAESPDTPDRTGAGS